MDSRKRVPVQSIGNLAVIYYFPWPVIIERCIPDISKEEIIGIIKVEKIIGHTCRDIKPKLGRIDKNGRLRDNYRLRSVPRFDCSR